MSTEHQENRNQFDELRVWAGRRSLDVAGKYVTRTPRGRRATAPRARSSPASARTCLPVPSSVTTSFALVWAIDGLHRRGIEDTLSVLRQLYERGCDVWSHQEPWLVTSEPRMRELLIAFMAWMAQQESARRSGRIKADIERRRHDIAAGRIEGTVGGRKQGARDRRRRSSDGYEAAWAEGGKRRVAAERGGKLGEPTG